MNVLVRQSWWATLLTEYRFSLFLLAQMTDRDDDGDVEDNDHADDGGDGDDDGDEKGN